MTWEAIARKDVRDAIRSYWLWGLSGLFVLFFTVPAFFLADRIGTAAQQQGEQISSDALLGVLVEINAFFVPVIAIGLAYAAIAGERDSGSLKLLLSLPHSRQDVVVGKFLGRSLVVLIALTAGFLVAGFTFLITPITFAGENYVLFALLTGLLAVVFVGIAIGVSAAAQSSRRAMLGTVAVYVVLVLFWDRSTNGMMMLLQRYADVSVTPMAKLHLSLKILNPTQAYKSLTNAIIIGDTFTARISLVSGMRQLEYAQALGESVPPYLSNPSLLVVMFLWLGLSLLLGFLIFKELDL